uniref:S-locus glycoprotein domain-containing protein n=1 Tax=Opuntia streptacantha TaxID=393608 RepID=A0A7C9ESV5_OPUST
MTELSSPNRLSLTEHGTHSHQEREPEDRTAVLEKPIRSLRWAVHNRFRQFFLPQVFVWDGDHPHWPSRPWNGNILIGVWYNFVDFINAHLVIPFDKRGTISLSYFYPNKSLPSMYMLSSAGEFTQICWDEGKRSWEIEVQVPETESDIYGSAGHFGPETRNDCTERLHH